ncbi:MAG TPA: RNA polymerase sigma-I factor [Acetivibrio sp.]|uniref:RNA polymerase sigma-I factor n=1 Tax=Acetivibrio sp. TaxID=1872092 RepID=UPI002C7D9D90|nr:RNA polymerase sigma-I factor [Acetivibrio sp.]HOM01546.1 RNA polymerase sigma-I factor [Acetivibrio sp.]
MHGLFINKKKNDTDANSIALVIKKIQNGDVSLKEEFIKDNVPYIIRTISNILGIVVDDRNSEEFSIGLSAFNEAIDRYDAEKNGNFYTYSFVVIKSRLFDFIRRNKKHSNVLPFSYIEQSTRVEDRLLSCDSNGQFEKIEVRQELVSFEKNLKEFGISLEDLVLSSPKHRDSRLLSIKIAQIIAADDEIFKKLVEKKYIPMKELLRRIKVNHKTIQRNRKFIIAVSLILRSNLYDLKEYVQGFEREGKYNG